MAIMMRDHPYLLLLKVTPLLVGLDHEALECLWITHIADCEILKLHRENKIRLKKI